MSKSSGDQDYIRERPSVKIKGKENSLTERHILSQ